MYILYNVHFKVILSNKVTPTLLLKQCSFDIVKENFSRFSEAHGGFITRLRKTQKVFFLVARPLRGGDMSLATKKKKLFCGFP